MSRNFDALKDERLLEGIRKGDNGAWDTLVDICYHPLYLYVLGMTRRPEIAEELVQDVLVSFWAKREQISIISSLKSYLYRAARNHTLNYLKRNAFERQYQHELAQGMSETSNTTSQELQLQELQERLDKAIAALPETTQEVFKLSRFHELSYKEIAETLDQPIRQVHYHISQALKSLRQQLQDYLDTPKALLAWAISSLSPLLEALLAS